LLTRAIAYYTVGWLLFSVPFAKMRIMVYDYSHLSTWHVQKSWNKQIKKRWKKLASHSACPILNACAYTAHEQSRYKTSLYQYTIPSSAVLSRCIMHLCHEAIPFNFVIHQLYSLLVWIIVVLFDIRINNCISLTTLYAYKSKNSSARFVACEFVPELSTIF
jgi:hypothetical protein